MSIKIVLIAAFSLCALQTGQAVSTKSGQTIPNIVGDGRTMNTDAFNSAIDRISTNGGGVLSVPPGKYLTGTIYLKSGVTLHLESGAEILGSTNLSDYPDNPPASPSKTLEYGRYSLIYASGQHDLAITGEGTIAGQGSDSNFTKTYLIEHGWSATDAYLKRPYGLCFVGCRHLQVRDVTIENTAFWTEDYLNCNDVVINSVTVNNYKKDYNNDGIDVDGSRNVRISDCFIVSGDDGVCLKSSYSMCENVTVTNCVIRSMCNGIKLGTASRVGFKNISVSNCVIYKTGLAGIALEMVDGGVLDGVTVMNLTMDGVGAPIFIRLGNRAKNFLENQPPASVGVLRNVTISNVIATLFSRDGTLSSSINGLPGHPVENINISNLRIALKDGFDTTSLDDFQANYQSKAKNVLSGEYRNEIKRLGVQDVPEEPADYPEYSMFGPLPTYGLYLRHARGVSIDRVDFNFDKEELRSALAIYDVEGLRLAGINAESSPNSNPVVVLCNVKDCLMTSSLAETGTSVFLRVDGQSDSIVVLDSDLSRAAAALSIQPGLEGRAIKLGMDVITPASRVPAEKQ